MCRLGARATSIKLVLTGLLLVSAFATNLVHAKEVAAANGLRTVTVAELPEQGVQTYRLIQSGGPFPYEKDGVVFGNRERVLPVHKRGYYREYTVRTPSARNRGVRRIVCGGQPKTPDACYYSNDHYASFRLIVP